MSKSKTTIPWRALTLLAALAVIWIAFSLATDGTFLSPRNLSLLTRQTTAKLERRMNPDGSSHPDAGNRGERRDGIARNAPQRAAATREHRLPQLERRPLLRPGAQQEGEQFGGAQRLDPKVDEPLARTIRPGHLTNGKRARHILR